MIAPLLGSQTSVAAERQEPGIHEDSAVLAIVADDACQHADCDILDAARAELGLDEVAEGINAHASLGHAIQIAPVMNCRGGYDADDRAGEAGGTEALRGFDGERALLFGHNFEFTDVAASV